MIEVRAVEDFPRLLDEIHDWWFEFERLDPGSQGVVELEFRPKISDFESRAGPVKTLQIHNVSRLEIADTERVGYYDLNKIAYRDGVLQFVTGIPLGLKFHLNELHLTLYQGCGL